MAELPACASLSASENPLLHRRRTAAVGEIPLQNSPYDGGSRLSRCCRLGALDLGTAFVKTDNDGPTSWFHLSL